MKVGSVKESLVMAEAHLVHFTMGGEGQAQVGHSNGEGMEWAQVAGGGEGRHLSLTP